MNVFFNSKSVQGEMDYQKLALMVPEIDVHLAGLDDIDLSFIEVELPKELNVEVPTFEPQEEKVKTKHHEESSQEEKKQAVKEAKAKVKEGAIYEEESLILPCLLTVMRIKCFS